MSPTASVIALGANDTDFAFIVFAAKTDVAGSMHRISDMHKTTDIFLFMAFLLIISVAPHKLKKNVKYVHFDIMLSQCGL